MAVQAVSWTPVKSIAPSQTCYLFDKKIKSIVGSVDNIYLMGINA